VTTLPGYFELSLSVAWRIRQTTLRLIVDNALDDEHQDSVGLPAPGARARLRWSRDL
jgi:outer membrane cobalamin receptor